MRQSTPLSMPVKQNNKYLKKIMLLDLGPALATQTWVALEKNTEQREQRLADSIGTHGRVFGVHHAVPCRDVTLFVGITTTTTNWF